MSIPLAESKTNVLQSSFTLEEEQPPVTSATINNQSSYEATVNKFIAEQHKGFSDEQRRLNEGNNSPLFPNQTNMDPKSKLNQYNETQITDIHHTMQQRQQIPQFQRAQPIPLGPYDYQVQHTQSSQMGPYEHQISYGRPSPYYNYQVRQVPQNIYRSRQQDLQDVHTEERNIQVEEQQGTNSPLRRELHMRMAESRTAATSRPSSPLEERRTNQLLEERYNGERLNSHLTSTIQQTTTIEKKTTIDTNPLLYLNSKEEKAKLMKKYKYRDNNDITAHISNCYNMLYSQKTQILQNLDYTPEQKTKALLDNDISKRAISLLDNLQNIYGDFAHENDYAMLYHYAKPICTQYITYHSEFYGANNPGSKALQSLCDAIIRRIIEDKKREIEKYEKEE